MRFKSTSLQEETYYDQQIDRDQLQIRPLVVLVNVWILEVHLLELAGHQMRFQGGNGGVASNQVFSISRNSRSGFWL